MKKLVLLFFVFAFITTKAQTVDEIIQQHANTMGGLDNVNKLQSLKKTGTMISQGLELQMTIQVINHNAMRTDLEAMGLKLTICYKDGKGWTRNPFAGDTTANDITGSELSELKSQTMISSQLMDYKARGHQVELIGKEDVNGAPAYKIKLINKENSKETFYLIDSSTSLLLKLYTIELDNVGDEMKMETIFSDLKNIGEIKFNMTQTQILNGQPLRELKFKTVEVNVPIDEKIFEKQ